MYLASISKQEINNTTYFHIPPLNTPYLISFFVFPLFFENIQERKSVSDTNIFGLFKEHSVHTMCFSDTLLTALALIMNNALNTEFDFWKEIMYMLIIHG